MAAIGEEQVIGSSQRPPVTRDRLVNDLAALGLAPGSTVLVHSSLSQLGWV